MPYSMTCYFFGTSTCPFPSFAAGSAIGVLPTVFFFVFVGSTMETMAEAAAGAAVTRPIPGPSVAGASGNSDIYWCEGVFLFKLQPSYC
jgi:uncharacterized membrane protein YdjX (TVP38/TMEM64 family)